MFYLAVPLVCHATNCCGACRDSRSERSNPGAQLLQDAANQWKELPAYATADADIPTCVGVVSGICRYFGA